MALIEVKIEKCETSGDSSDDECLLDLKRKINNSNNSNKRSKSEDNGDIYPEVLVNVKVGQFADNFKNASKTLNPKKKSRPNKKKGDHEGSEEKKPRKRNFDKDGTRFKHKCGECGKSFATAFSLKRHHSGQANCISPMRYPDQRHKCGECTKSFTTAFSLRRHQLGHLRPPQKCPYCEVIFNMKMELKRHITTHDITDKSPQLDAIAVKTDDGQFETIMIKQGANENKIAPGEIKIEPKLLDGDEKVTAILRRDQLTYLTQCAIVSKMHKGKSANDICLLYNLTPEVVNEIWEDRNKFVLPSKDETKTVKYMNSIIDKKVIDWYNTQKDTENQITNRILQDMADMYAKECGLDAFKGCKKWLDRFKKKYNIALDAGDSQDYNYSTPGIECKWKKQFFNETWCDVRVGYSNEDIYTADEVGLFYNASKGRIKKCGGKKFVQGHVKDRFSILMCANVTGSDKKKLLVCGTEDPLLHSNRNPDTLPVTYIRHSRAHFTTEIFEEYVKYWNRELQSIDRTVLLILDRAFIHSKLQLSNLKLVFVPWKASIGLIPIKNGIFRRMRYEFRKLLLEEKAMNALRGLDRNLTCLEALNMLDKAWDRVTPQAIYKSFETIGYDIDECDFKPTKRLGVSDNDEEVLCNLLKDFDVESYFTSLGNLDTYLPVDEEFLKVRGALAEADGKCKGEVLPIGSEKLESNNEDLVVRARAFEDIEIVKNFLQTHGTSYEMFCSFMDVENFVLNCPINVGIVGGDSLVAKLLNDCPSFSKD